MWVQPDWMILVSSSSRSQLQGPRLAREEDVALVKAASSRDRRHIIGASPRAAFMGLIHNKLIYVSLKVKHSQKVNIPKPIACLCSVSSIRSGAPKGSSTHRPPTKSFGKKIHRPAQTPTEPPYTGLCQSFLMRMAFLNACFPQGPFSRKRKVLRTSNVC